MNITKICMATIIISSIIDVAFFNHNSAKIILDDITMILLAISIIIRETKGTGCKK